MEVAAIGERRATHRYVGDRGQVQEQPHEEDAEQVDQVLARGNHRYSCWASCPLSHIVRFRM